MSIPTRPERITVVGAGAIGSAILPLLATLQPRHLRVIDGDTVEAGNLVRQPLYGPLDVGSFKVKVAAERLRVIVPELELETEQRFLDERNAPGLLGNAQIVVDCTDDRPARLLIDRICGELSTPLVSGAVHRHQIQVMSLHVSRPGSRAASLRSFFPHRTSEEQDGCSMQDVPLHVTALAATVMVMRIQAVLNGDETYADTMDVIDPRNAGWMRIAAPDLGEGELIAHHTDSADSI